MKRSDETSAFEPTVVALGDPPRSILVNSIVAAVLAEALMVIAHELCHLVTGLALGTGGTLFPFGVSPTVILSPTGIALTAISAPLFSLVSGALLAVWQPLRSRGGFGQVLWIWFAFVSIMEGVGYLVITPFGAGDTAATADALGWPLWPRLVACGIGIAGMFGAARMFAPLVRRYAGTERVSTWAFAFWPWVIGSVIDMLLSVIYLSLSAAQLSGGEQMAIVMAGMSAFVFAPMSFIFRGSVVNEPFEPLRLRPVPVGGVVGVVAVLVVNLILVRGFTVGH